MIKQLQLLLIATGILFHVTAQDVIYAEYFIDADPGFGEATTIENFVPGEETNVVLHCMDAMSQGFHNLGIRTKDANSWSQTNFTSIYVLKDTVYDPIQKVQYFWVSDPGFQDPMTPDFNFNQPEINIVKGKAAVNVPADFQPGSYSLYMRSQDSLGYWSHTQLVKEIYICPSSYLTYLEETVCESYTSPTGQVYTESGVYREYVNTSQECDSSYLISLNVISIDTAVTLNNQTLQANYTSADSYQWVDCNNGFDPISGAVNHSYTPLENGNYAVIITEEDCSDTSSCHQVNVAGIDNVKEFGVSIYPNPNKGSFTLELNDRDDYSITISDAYGKSIMSRELSRGKHLKFSLDQPAGVYFIIIRGRTDQLVSKFIIEGN